MLPFAVRGGDLPEPLPKPRRQVDPGYLDFIRGRVCLVPGCRRRGEAHHLTSRGAGGSDYSAVPLCRGHHAAIHNVGLDHFQRVYFVPMNLWRDAAELLAAYFTRRETA